jgi:hypothetical protein
MTQEEKSSHALVTASQDRFVQLINSLRASDETTNDQFLFFTQRVKIFTAMLPKKICASIKVRDPSSGHVTIPS